MKIERFEDIKAWQEGRSLTKMVFRITSVHNLIKSYRLKDQMEGASISVMGNTCPVKYLLITLLMFWKRIKICNSTP